MNLRQLEYFVAVAEELHFTRAAERLHIAQQPLSAQIKALETELGVQLFQRSTRHVALTEAGAAFLEAVRLSLGHLEAGIVTARRLAHGLQGVLRLGVVPPIRYSILSEVLGEMAAHYPGLTVEVQEGHSPYLEEAVLNGGLDAALLAWEKATPGLMWESLFEEPIMVAVPAGHRLAGCAFIPLNALANEGFILYDRVQKPLSHAQVAALCAAAGFQPIFSGEARTSEEMLHKVATGLGVSLVTAGLSACYPDGVAYRPLTEPALTAQFGLTYLENTPLIDALRAAIETALTRRESQPVQVGY